MELCRKVTQLVSINIDTTIHCSTECKIIFGNFCSLFTTSLKVEDNKIFRCDRCREEFQIDFFEPVNNNILDLTI